MTGRTFTGPAITGVVASASADWQILLPDGTTLGDVRYTLQTDGGDSLRPVARHAPRPRRVLARLARGEEVAASEFTFRTGTRIETAAAAWNG